MDDGSELKGKFERSAGARDVDLHLGRRLRSRRRLLGLTQAQLGEMVGIRFQQIQKYECAGNRISAKRLLELSNALNVPVTYFYDGLGGVKAMDSTLNDMPQHVKDYAVAWPRMCEDDRRVSKSAMIIATEATVQNPRIRGLDND